VITTGIAACPRIGLLKAMNMSMRGQSVDWRDSKFEHVDLFSIYAHLGIVQVDLNERPQHTRWSMEFKERLPSKWFFLWELLLCCLDFI
jgi:hypothetical protein